ncbi:site-specific DNA-methyltransferase [Corynebacterium suicordis]
MSRLTDLIAQAKRENPRLGAELEREIRSRTHRSFGLVFERHLPEKVELPGRPVRRGDGVHVLPERGSLERPDKRTWQVIDVLKNDVCGRVARLAEGNPKADSAPELRTDVPVDDLVVVAQQDDVIYPGLVQTGEVIGSDDSDAPFHSLINAENYHALMLMTYTHFHSVDCIYIDPPYNTGAKDWKYNNDYVDGEDAYRHSKWLSFIERRLLVAKSLLKPEDSVLVVTIDEKEYLRLGMLLEQTFPEATIQMVSVAISSSGVSRSAFSRSDEYYYFVFFGKSQPKAVQLGEEWSSGRVKRQKGVRWESLLRSGNNGRRVDRPNLAYPVYLDADDGSFHSFGEPLDLSVAYEDNPTPNGLVAVFPRASDGSEACWRISSTKAEELRKTGAFRVSKFKGESTAIYYLKPGELAKIEDGTYTLDGLDDEGVMVISATGTQSFLPTTQWNVTSHNAGTGGSQLTRALLPGRKFPFPKSLYAVEDALRFFIRDKPDATVLDFFAGSGTTAHAVMRLNKQDGGRRRSISITNNEVGVDEQKKLRAQGLRPGDADWEKWGICDYVTKPRIQAAITGRTPDGEPIKGDYKFTDEFPMSDGFEANARFFTLTYQPPTRVRHGYAFKEIAPMLWMRAGQVGRIISEIPERGWDVAESYGVIENVAASKDFLAAVIAQRGVRVVYIATNDDLVFESMARELADTDAELVRLYSTYLNNFAFQQARENSK